MDAPISLRRLQMSDIDRVLDAFTSPGMERQGTVRNRDEAAAYVARLLDEHAHHAWAIVDPGDDLVGLVVVSLDEANRSGWFWYWMSASCRGKGWTSRAAATVASWALADGGLHRLELGHRRDNPSSRGVALAAGFIQEGTQREKFLVDGNRVDVLTYGRLQGDPVPNIDVVPFR